MIISIPKNEFLEKLSIASHFTLTKLSSIPSLQGALLKFGKNKIEIITTNLNEFFHTEIKTEAAEEKNIGIDIKKIVEFLSLLPSVKINIEIKENVFIIESNKTKGKFNLIKPDDFPKLPEAKGKKYLIKKSFLEKKLPLVLFATAKDETRPILTGVYFSTSNDKKYIVGTDGFRLSLLTDSQKEIFPNITVSANVLNELLKLKEEGDDEVEMIFSEKEKIVKYKIGSVEIYSRILEGDYPPFEKVIPAEYKTKVILDRDEFLKNIKLSAIFAREFSNIIIFEIKKDGVYIRPRVGENEGSEVFQESEVEGEEQKIAFNYKFILDFLNNTKAKKIIFEMSQANAPSVFKEEGNNAFIHVIMPVRTDEEIT